MYIQILFDSLCLARAEEFSHSNAAISMQQRSIVDILSNYKNCMLHLMTQFSHYIDQDTNSQLG